MFQEFPKIARLNRECIITEKIDGTNASVVIVACACQSPGDACSDCAGVPFISEMINDGIRLRIAAGSRTRYITPDNDNHGFAKFVQSHACELMVGLGPGRHFGEWWGSGIQGSYGLPKGEKRFSLFNTSRWVEADRCGAGLSDGQQEAPSCCHVVPVLYRGNFKTVAVEDALQQLRIKGSVASPGFMKPEGVVVYHTAANMFFKVTLEKDEQPKGLRR